MHKWLKEHLMPFFASDTGADGGQADGDNGGAETPPDTTDYKALYEKSLADNKKLKASFDQTSHEVAELKKAQKAKMSEAELEAAKLEEERAHYKELESQVNEMRTTTVFAKAGFAESDYADVIKKVVEVSGEKASELAETIIEFVKKANKSAVANAKNAAIKDGAIPPKTSTSQADGNAKSDYQLYQESKTKTSNIVEL